MTNFRTRGNGGTWSIGTLTYGSGAIIALFAWLLFGDFVWSMRDRSIGPMTQWYLGQLNVSNIVFGLIVSSFPAAIGLVLAPAVSVSSDRHRGPRGRRIPFLIVTTPLAAFGMIGIGLTPIISALLHDYFPGLKATTVALLCFMVFWTLFEFASITTQTVFGGLINDVVPKEMLGRFFGFFRAISLIDGMIFHYWITGNIPSHFTLIMIVVGILYGAGFLLVCFKVREGEYPPPPPREPSSGGVFSRFGKEAGIYIRECFTRPYYLMVFFMVALANLSFAPINIFALPYATSLGIDMDTYGKYLALTYLISLCLAPVLGWLVDCFHPLRMAIFSLIGYMAVTAWGVFFATTSAGFLAAWVAHGVVSGCYFTTSASLGQRLFPHEKFAQYASAVGILVSFVSIGIAPVVGIWIDVTGNAYGNTFVGGFALAFVSLLFSFAVYRRFIGYGGAKAYIAPE